MREEGTQMRKALKVTVAVAFGAAVCLFSMAYTGVISRNTVRSLLPSAALLPSVAAAESTSVNTIPVLLYHGIVSPHDKAENSVTLTAFRSQMRYLHAQGYQTISPEQYVQWEEGKHPELPLKPILITFDSYQTISPEQYVQWEVWKHLELPLKPILITFDCNQTSALLTQGVLPEY